MKARPWGAWAGLAVLCVTLPLAAAATPAMRGWQPVVLFAGAGEPERALTHLRALSRLHQLSQAHLVTDAPTQAFLDELSEALEDFAIDELYALLPEKDGAWRRLRIFGGVDGETYRLGRPRPGVDTEVGRSGKRRKLGDFSAVAEVKPVADRRDAEDHNFLVRGRAGFGIGAIGQPQVLDAVRDVFRIAESGASLPAPATKLDDRIAARHPALDEGERRVLAVAYSAFPAVSRVLERFGRVERLLVRRAAAGADYEHVKAVFRMRPGRLERHYGAFAAYLEDLGQLADLQMAVLDANGRRLLSARLRTETLRGSVECFLRDGELLPVEHRDGKTVVYVDTPWSLSESHALRAQITARFDVLGVQMDLRRLPVELEYLPEKDGIEVRAALRRMPGVKVGGAALGFVPTGLVDLLIPSNIEGLARDFLRTATEGDGGRGVTFAMRHHQRAPGDNATLEVEGGLEALDNFFVELGVGVAADRVLPDEEQSRDIERALWDAQVAFDADLDRYARLLPRR